MDEQTRTAAQLQAQLDAATAQQLINGDAPVSLEDRQALLQQQQLLQEREAERTRLQVLVMYLLCVTVNRMRNNAESSK